MNASQIRRLLDAGITAVVTRQDGITERYDHTSNGEIVVTFIGGKVCKYCGHKLEHDASCRCDKEFELITLTGCYRHINSLAKRVGKVKFDDKTRKLLINEKEELAC